MMASEVMVLVADINVPGVFFGPSTNQCATFFADIDAARLHDLIWISTTVWDVLALCLAAWILVIHFHELRQRVSTGSIIRAYFTVLIKSYMLYFVAFVALSWPTVFGTSTPICDSYPYLTTPHHYYSSRVRGWYLSRCSQFHPARTNVCARTTSDP